MNITMMVIMNEQSLKHSLIVTRILSTCRHAMSLVRLLMV